MSRYIAIALVFGSALTGCEFEGGLFGTWIEAWSQHWPGSFMVHLSYLDHDQRAFSVSVSGPGISGSLDLTYNAWEGEWNSLTLPSSSVDFGAAHPAPPLTYTFSVTDASGTWTAQAVVDAFMEELPTNVLPSGDVFGSFSFSWTPLSQSGVEYQVQLSDQFFNRLWDSDRQGDISSVPYSGQSLVPGTTYNYWVAAEKGDVESFGVGSFTWYP